MAEADATYAVVAQQMMTLHTAVAARPKTVPCIAWVARQTMVQLIPSRMLSQMCGTVRPPTHSSSLEQQSDPLGPQ